MRALGIGALAAVGVGVTLVPTDASAQSTQYIAVAINRATGKFYMQLQSSSASAKQKAVDRCLEETTNPAYKKWCAVKKTCGPSPGWAGVVKGQWNGWGFEVTCAQPSRRATEIYLQNYCKEQGWTSCDYGYGEVQ